MPHLHRTSHTHSLDSSVSASLSLKQVGNAVHSGVATLVFKALISRAVDLEVSWIEEFDVEI